VVGGGRHVVSGGGAFDDYVSTVSAASASLLGGIFGSFENGGAVDLLNVYGGARGDSGVRRYGGGGSNTTNAADK